MFYCPYCKTLKPMSMKGLAFNGKGEKMQRYKCSNESCGKTTIYPLKNKK